MNFASFKRFLVTCSACGGQTNKQYAQRHEGKCKGCVTGKPVAKKQEPTREQRIIDSGYQAYAREEGHYDTGDY